MNLPLLLAAASVPHHLASIGINEPLVLHVDPPDNLDDLLWDIEHRAYESSGVQHMHEGRLKHQYARQPRASSHRICRGRP